MSLPARPDEDPREAPAAGPSDLPPTGSLEAEIERAAAGDLERLIVLSDGVFAIAMTLLVVELSLPEITGGRTSDLTQQLLGLGPKYLSYAVSFGVIASYWAAHQRIFREIVRWDGRLMWLNLLLLLCIAFQPFPTSVLGSYGDQAVAVTLYAGTLAVTGTVVLALWLYATWGHRLVRQDLDRRRIQEHTLRAAGAPVVFMGSIGVAQVNPALAEYSWLLTAVLLVVIRWRHRD